jgi:hypothetical protein
MPNADTSSPVAAISRIVGLEWTGLGRAADLVWCTFGRTVKWLNYKGELVDKPEYSLHLQCPFRIAYQGRIRVGSSDIYLSTGNQVTDSAATSDEAVAFDIKATAITSGIGLSRAAWVAVSGFGDISIRFANGLTLESFAVASDDYESWRLVGFGEPRFDFVFPDREVS